MLCLGKWRGLGALALVCATLPAVVGAQPAAAAGRGPSSAQANLGRPAVAGILVAKPVNGESSIPPQCQSRDMAPINTAIQQQRGLVVCTGRGKLVLLELSAGTTFHARFWGPATVGSLRDGDRIRAWGTLSDGGYLLNPTVAVQDVDEQRAKTRSQDFVADSGQRLTLYVLSSEKGGPVEGVVYAVPGGATKVYLCNGSTGTWADLTVGTTIDVSRSLFNRRINTYVDTDAVHIVDCR